MKKLIVFAACAMLAAVTQAASVGWTLAGANSYAGDAYQFFVIGQKGATDIATITTLLDAGTDTSSYAFGSGTVGSSGAVSASATAAGAPTLSAGTYTAFYVVFDEASPTAGSSNYAVVSGASTLTKTVGASAATVSFVGGNASSTLNNAANWKSFGPATPTPPTPPDPSGVPEPTSGLLFLVGGAMLALRRKQK